MTDQCAGEVRRGEGNHPGGGPALLPPWDGTVRKVQLNGLDRSARTRRIPVHLGCDLGLSTTWGFVR